MGQSAREGREEVLHRHKRPQAASLIEGGTSPRGEVCRLAMHLTIPQVLANIHWKQKLLLISRLHPSNFFVRRFCQSSEPSPEVWRGQNIGNGLRAFGMGRSAMPPKGQCCQDERASATVLWITSSSIFQEPRANALPVCEVDKTVVTGAPALGITWAV